MRSIDRRLLLRALGACGGLTLLSRSSQSRERGDDPQKSLVLVQLSGGNDGLSTVVPHGDDNYHRERKTTRYRASEVLTIDGYRGFHPALKRMHARMKEGGLAVIEGVGYANPNRSHFKSLDVWHTADRDGRSSGEGWVGRLCEAAFGAEALPERVVHVGSTAPYSLYSTRHPALSFALPRNYRWLENEKELARMSDVSRDATDESSTRRSRLDRLRRVMRDAHASSRQVRSAVASYRPKTEYPSDVFGDSLRTVAALIHSDLGTRILSVELGGFDTHVDQKNRHDRLMRTLDASLVPFLEDLEMSESGRETLVLVFSEFGRRVAENASKGTDHGCASLMLAAGSQVKGGLYGEHPSLSELDEGDLIFTTDFRSVYATAIRSVFGIDPGRALGSDYPTLGFV